MRHPIVLILIGWLIGSFFGLSTVMGFFTKKA